MNSILHLNNKWRHSAILLNLQAVIKIIVIFKCEAKHMFRIIT